MKLSSLQRYILWEAYGNRGILVRPKMNEFYKSAKRQPKAHDLANIVSRSLDRLVAKELAVGFGRKTAKRWYIESIKLTPKGRAAARRLLGEQQTLPLKVKIKNAKGKSESHSSK